MRHRCVAIEQKATSKMSTEKSGRDLTAVTGTRAQPSRRLCTSAANAEGVSSPLSKEVHGSPDTAPLGLPQWAGWHLYSRHAPLEHAAPNHTPGNVKKKPRDTRGMVELPRESWVLAASHGKP